MKLRLIDPTLRDGNHAVGHSLDLNAIRTYCEAMDGSGVDVIEVGHGNGLGASSLQLGRARHTDEEMLRTAREHLRQTKLGVHAIPGFAKLDDIERAIAAGVDVVRVASHCTEADVTERYIERARDAGAEVHGVLMMSHMATPEKLLEQARLQRGYGAEGIVLMDSAGAYLPRDVHAKVGLLAAELDLPIGFHAHNNLGLAVANTLAAVEAGATICDGTLGGFGAGAGNTQLEVLVAALAQHGYEAGIDLFTFLSAAQAGQTVVDAHRPTIREANILSGLFGVFSGFERPVARAAAHYSVDAKEIYRELGRRRVVAGQEDLIVEIAVKLQASTATRTASTTLPRHRREPRAAEDRSP